MDFTESMERIARGFEVVGIAVIILGALIATVHFLRRLHQGSGFSGVYDHYRVGLGRALILGLEFLIAAEVIRTVVISRTLGSAGTLAIIVVTRSFPSVMLEVELEGRWPWQREQTPDKSVQTEPEER